MNLFMKIVRNILPLVLLFCFPLFAVEEAACSTSPPQVQAWKISSKQETFLDNLERDTFDFFWKTTNPKNGLTPDRFPNNDFSSVAGVGFALTAYTVGVERGYINRSEAAHRTLTTLKFLWQGPQGPERTGVAGYKGFFYHFLDINTGLRLDDSELSTIDTALLMSGVLSSQSYFNGDADVEREIRSYAEALYRRVDWTWAYSRDNKPLISLGWYPETGFLSYDWSGYNEAMILYILAMASPTHAIDPHAWDKWTSTYHWDTFYGYSYVNFGPLFGHQYSHVWIDFRHIQDQYMRAKGIDYFINSQRATYANRAYCIDNPKGWHGYNDMFWGLTASDGPNVARMKPSAFQSYWARGASANYMRDDGTLAPTAVGGSVAFAPAIAIPTLEHLHSALGSEIYGEYGFKDAFNLSYRGDSAKSQGWFDSQYLAVDQGPILLMIENYRSGFVWDLMKRNMHIVNGLRRAGFTGGWLDSSPSQVASGRAPLKTPRS